MTITPMIIRRCVLALMCLLFGGAIATATGAAKAQAVPTAQSEAKPTTEVPPTIVLLFEPERPDSSRLIRAIESHLVGLPVRVVLEPLSRGEILTWLESGHLRARAQRALGLLAIDTGQGDLWRLFFLDADGAPTLIWRLRPSPEQAPLDEAGVAARLLVEALLDAGSPGIAAPVLRGEPPPSNGRLRDRGTAKHRDRSKGGEPREPPRESSPRPRPSPPPPSPGEAPRDTPGEAREPRFALFLGPSTTSWLVDQGWQFGATGGVEFQLARAWSLALAYTWYPTLEYQLADTDLSLSRRPLMSYVAYAPASGFSPRFWLGMWTDPVLRSTPSTTGTYRGNPAQTTWSWGPVGGVGVATASLDSFSLRFDLGLEVDARRVEYVAEGSTSSLLASTRRVRPFLSLCLRLRL